MKVFVKTLKGTHFNIEVKPEDAVADVKKNIETVQGADVYPAAQQMLIYKGKVLKDDTTLAENSVTENSFIVIMLTTRIRVHLVRVQLLQLLLQIKLLRQVVCQQLQHQLLLHLLQCQLWLHLPLNLLLLHRVLLCE
ncbi:hypothetical protein Gogos_000557 [Gossypium gossypioides]|uniref:Ubiquitin-like domain-containing protein n=1 Tax=Gossypium gossypioides TaxID=34282 RepID=A0A7J9CTT5_GOSGO|nr:hypothetical protein [Gossypium gossypioides]